MNALLAEEEEADAEFWNQDAFAEVWRILELLCDVFKIQGRSFSTFHHSVPHGYSHLVRNDTPLYRLARLRDLQAPAPAAADEFERTNYAPL